MGEIGGWRLGEVHMWAWGSVNHALSRKQENRKYIPMSVWVTSVGCALLLFPNRRKLEFFSSSHIQLSAFSNSRQKQRDCSCRGLIVINNKNKNKKRQNQFFCGTYCQERERFNGQRICIIVYVHSMRFITSIHTRTLHFASLLVGSSCNPGTSARRICPRSRRWRLGWW